MSKRTASEAIIDDQQQQVSESFKKKKTQKSLIADDIIYEILNFLNVDFKYFVMNYAMVSKQWFQVTSERFKFHLTCRSTSLQFEPLKNCQFLQNIESLTVKKFSDKDANEFKVLELMKGLKRLDLSENRITDQDFEQISSKLTNQLTHLNVFGNIIKNEGVEFITKMDKLTFLDIGLNYLNDEGVKLISEMKHLKELNIYSNYNIGNEGIKYLSSMKQLTYLIVSELSNEGAQYISSLPNLNKLKFSSYTMTSEGYKFIGEMNHLKELTIRYSSGIGKFQHLNNLKQLTHLNLENSQITIEGCKNISELENLTHLELNRNWITSKGAKIISQSMLKVTFLDISECNIEKEGVEYISTMKQLTFLNISDNNIQQDGVKCLENLKLLKTLNISYNEIGELDMESISQLSQLNTLNVCGNDIGDKGIEIIGNMKQLTSLSIHHIESEAIYYIGEMPNLTHLNFSGYNITSNIKDYFNNLKQYQIEKSRKKKKKKNRKKKK